MTEVAQHVHERITSPARLEALHRPGVLDIDPHERLDRITRFATAMLDTPVALVSLVDGDRQVFVSQAGLAEPWAERGETPLSHSFCQHVVADGTALVITDAREDERLRDNGAITDLGVIAYCGVPLTTPEGHTLGSFCVIGSEPRHWTPAEVAVVEDLAVLVRNELALSELQAGADAGRGVGELVAALAHDMRGMVFGLAGGARTLARAAGLSADHRDKLAGVVERQADHLGDLLDQLLAASTVIGGAAVSLEPVDVGALLRDVVDGYRLAGIDRVDVQVALGLHASAEPTNLRRCVTNLVENALKHGGAGLPVHVVGSWGPGGEVRITVADEGPGIPLEEQASVFRRGQQAVGSAGGHGLGLHIVRTLVTAMQGTVWLESVAGEGASFTIELEPL